MTPDETWRCTPHEILLTAKATEERDMRHAWMVGYLSRVKEFPSFKQFMGEKQTETSIEKMRQEHQEIVAKLGV